LISPNKKTPPPIPRYSRPAPNYSLKLSRPRVSDIICPCMIKKAILILTAAIVLSACSIPFIGKKQTALQITSSPTSVIFLNDSHAGNTPYFDDNLKSGNYTVKLTPESGGQDWETKVTLSPKLLTVINRQFGDSPEQSSYYILQLESLANQNSTELAVVVTPDSAIIKVDNQPKGFAPLSLNNITAGEHTITLAAPGYKEIEIKPKTQVGHKLTISAQLAKDKGLPQPQVQKATESGQIAGDTDTDESKDSEATTSAKKLEGIISGTTTPNILEKPYVEITETGTGWLRVHSDSTPGETNEIAKVKVGTYFEVVSTKGGWYKIRVQRDTIGWIVSRYADLAQ